MSGLLDADKVFGGEVIQFPGRDKERLEEALSDSIELYFNLSDITFKASILKYQLNSLGLSEAADASDRIAKSVEKQMSEMDPILDGLFRTTYPAGDKPRWEDPRDPDAVFEYDDPDPDPDHEPDD